ncbi:MAG: BamA/TamA family outer membrane protein [Tannerella sp.]|jgi:outer membrane protein assembly factor BamA|nr:BamA/TamA family outer membrane protein [Tannerella sp.]
MKSKHLILLILIAGTWISCSSTRHLPSGEFLYTGTRKIEVTDKVVSSADESETMSEIEAALAHPPNGAVLGSSKFRSPFPVGLWAYNTFVNKRGVINRWLFKSFAEAPVLISTVNPEIRSKIAESIMKEHGYFNGTATYKLIPGGKDSLTAKIVYQLTMNEPYTYDSIAYRRIQHRADTLLQLSDKNRLLHTGDQFNVLRLEDERQRITALMRDNGYFYFRPDYIAYQADSTLAPLKVSLRTGLKQGLPPSALRPWKVGAITVHLNESNYMQPTDSVRYREMMIYYEGKLRVRPKELYNQFRFKPGDVYSQSKQTQTQAGLNRLGVFRYTEMQYTPKDTTFRCDTINLNVNAFYDLPLSGEMELNFTANNNRRVGPGSEISLTRHNLFGGGETMGVSLKGSYEWLVGKDNTKSNFLRDNYEYGMTSTLTFPTIVFPRFYDRKYDYQATTTFQLYTDHINRAEYFRLLSLGSNVTYDFRPNKIRHHSLSPFRLSYNLLQEKTPRFDSIVGNNKVLYQSLRDQFIPAISYTYTLDDSPVRKGRHTMWWQFSVTESGNILSAAYALAGTGFGKEKHLFGNPFSQFLKVTSELRHNHVLDRNRNLVTRLGMGVIYSYGNSEVSPYNEQFHIGGANSIRAFSSRSIGPGRFHNGAGERNTMLDHTGDLKLEANIEYRFNLIEKLEGAVFLDAGNVWLLKKTEETGQSNSLFEWRHFLNDVATGTGFGFRYNIDVLVIRLDIGIGLHLPYDTGKNGYFNIPNASEGMGIHIAVGYPF